MRCACLAQLVNAIAPILTEAGGKAWRQPIFWPFADFSRLGRGEVLRAEVQSPTYETVYRDPRGKTELEFPMPEVPFLKSAVVHSAEDSRVTLFLLNRSLDQEMSLAVEGKGFGELSPSGGTVLRHDDLEAVNTRDGETVAPSPFETVESSAEGLRLTLPPASWTVVQLAAS